jgi:nicotinamidase-related amidase
MVAGIRFGPIGENWVHLCTDMQQLFAPGGPWQVAWFEPVLPLLVALVERAPERTVFTRFVPVMDAESAAGTWQRYYRAWPQITRRELPDRYLKLAPSLDRFVPPARVVDKQVYSPWTEGRLDRLLGDGKVDTLLVTGGETEMCVLATVLGAVDRGFRVVLVRDGICSSRDSTHDAVMRLYEERFGQQIEVADLAEIMDAL